MAESPFPQSMLAAAIILTITYVGLIFTRLPRVNIDRPVAALAGGVLMVLVGVLSFDEAVGVIDFHTLALLLGMMLLVAVLQRAGFLSRWPPSPWPLPPPLPGS